MDICLWVYKKMFMSVQGDMIWYLSKHFGLKLKIFTYLEYLNKAAKLMHNYTCSLQYHVHIN